MTRVNRVAIVLGLAACVAACRPAPAADHVPEPPAALSTASLLERLALLATQRVPAADELARAAQAIDTEPAKLAAYIDDLLRDPQFGAEVAPSLFAIASRLHLREYVLNSMGTADGEIIYYLRMPCAAETAERVNPWWAPTTTVRVCPDSYRPDYLSRPGTDWQCASTKLNLDAASDCGCVLGLLALKRYCGRAQPARAGSGSRRCRCARGATRGSITAPSSSRGSRAHCAAITT